MPALRDGFADVRTAIETMLTGLIQPFDGAGRIGLLKHSLGILEAF
jgi:hypothetical protein